MLTAPRCLWLGVLVCVLAGCAGSYQAVPVPPVDPGVKSASDNKVDIAAGDDLRLQLRDGSRVSGYMTQIHDGCLMLRDVQAVSESQDSFTELPQPEDVTTAPAASFPLADIVLIERYERDVLGPVVGVVALVGVVFMMSEVFEEAFTLGND